MVVLQPLKILYFVCRKLGVGAAIGTNAVGRGCIFDDRPRLWRSSVLEPRLFQVAVLPVRSVRYAVSPWLPELHVPLPQMGHAAFVLQGPRLGSFPIM